MSWLRCCFLGLQAAQYLHEEAARYPRKIHYHNPPDLAMEALEVSGVRLVAQNVSRDVPSVHFYYV